MTVIPRTHDKTMPHDDLMRLVNAGDWDAKAIYGARLLDGDQIERDAETGLAMMEEAREAGSARASAGLGIHFAFENEFEKSEEYAAEAVARDNPYGWMARMCVAQETGDYGASFEAGKQFLAASDPADHDPDTIYNVAASAHFSGQYSEAIPYYETAAERGSRAAAINLALMISRKEVDLPEDRVRSLLHMAAERGAPAGATLYVNHLLNVGEGSVAVEPQTIEQAFTLLERNTEPGDYERLHLLATAFDKGLGRPQDGVEATRHFGLAAENEKDIRKEGPTILGLGRANIDYALRLAKGVGIDANPTAALDHCEKAATLALQGDVPDMVGAATFHALAIADDAGIEGIHERFEPYLKVAAEQGRPEMMVPYAQAVLKKTERMNKARPWFVRALAAEDPAGGIEAAQMLVARGETAEAYAFAHYAATDLGAQLPPELAALDSEARSKGLLFMKGKSGAEQYEELKVAVRETVEKYGFHEDED